MTVRINTDAQQAGPSPAVQVDDPLSAFPQESRTPNEESADEPNDTGRAGFAARLFTSIEPRLVALREQEERLEAVEATVAVLESRARTATTDLERHVDAYEAKEALVGQAVEQLGRRASDTISDLETRVATSLAAFEQRLPAIARCEQELARLERVVPQVERQLGDLDARAATEFERTSHARNALDQEIGELQNQLARLTASTSDEAKRLVEIKQQAADTINDLVTRVAGCEARARTTNETIAHLHDVTTRALPELQQRLKEADEKNDLVDLRITEATRLATSLTALEQRLPEISRCEQELARIERVVPQVERQLRDLDASVEQQMQMLVLNQHRADETLAEVRKTDTLVSGLEHRVADLSQSHLQLDAVDMRLGQLEQRAAGAATEFEQASDARNTLDLEVVELQNRLRQLTETAEGETKKLLELTELAERDQQDHARRASSVISGLETRLADVRSGGQLLDQIEEQLRGLESRRAAAVADIERASHANIDLSHEIVELQNQLRRLTASADDGAKSLVEIKQQAERDLHEHAQKASAVLSELESRMTALENGHHLFDGVERQLEQLEARAAVAIGDANRTTGAANGLEQRVVELQAELRRMIETADGEAKRLRDVTRQAARYRRSLFPNRLAFKGIAAALFIMVVALLGSAWRFSLGNAEAASPPPPPVLANGALTFTPNVPVPPLTPPLVDGPRELSNDNRRAPEQPAARIAQSVSAATGKAGGSGTLSQFTGTLVIESEPAGATAFVNQQPVGETPLVLKGLRIGSCVVRLEYDGYQRWSTAVSVSSTGAAHVTATLKRDGAR